MSTNISTNKVVHLDARQGELADLVARGTPCDGISPTAFAPLHLIRASEVSQPLPGVYRPCLCVVVQGRKRAIVGPDSYYYDAFNCLIVSVTLPMLGQIVEASPEQPYLCVRIDIDLHEVAQLLLELPADIPARSDATRPLHVARIPAELQDVVLRLMRMLDTPVDLPVLGPLALRELWYRLLRSDMAPQLLDLMERNGSVQRLHRAIELLQQRYAEPLRVEALADAAHMSVSTFHTHFKAMTALSPLQFQKQLRLHEARRLMLSEHLEAATAAHRVGYESPSQFSREYRRLFGTAPRQEVAARQVR